MQTRTNFFGGRLRPSAQYQREEWYWPTDDEFALIENVVRSGEYFIRYIDKYGEANAALLLDHLFSDGGKQYLWLSKHLSTPTATSELTEEIVLSSLEQFDAEVVEPWLAKHGKPVSPISR